MERFRRNLKVMNQFIRNARGVSTTTIHYSLFTIHYSLSADPSRHLSDMIIVIILSCA